MLLDIYYINALYNIRSHRDILKPYLSRSSDYDRHSDSIQGKKHI